MAERLCGREALESLAKRFPQLYVAPSEGAFERHTLATRRGLAPDGANLAHLHGSDEDELLCVETPAGPVEVLFLSDRSDFETFLQIVGHKSQLVPILPEVGAITYRGLADWGKVAAVLNEFVASGKGDAQAAFAHITANPSLVRTELIVISAGPYSNIPAAQTPYDETDWLRISRDIRLYHECAHVMCRRLMPDDILPLWDEVTADVTGLVCATGDYDPELAARFLGVSAQGYEGGRLAEYLDDDQMARVDEIAKEIYASQLQVAEITKTTDLSRSFDLLLELKRNPLIAY